MKAATKVDRLPAEGLSIVGGRAEMEERKMSDVWTVERHGSKWMAVCGSGERTHLHKTKREMKIELRMIAYGESRERAEKVVRR